MKQSLDLKLGQHLTITPQLQQAIRLLQLSSIELQQEIQEALESNPLLEEKEDDLPDTKNDNGLEQDETSSDSEIQPTDFEMEQSTLNDTDNNDADWEEGFDTFHTSTIRAEHNDSYTDIDARNSSPLTLQDHLHWQMQMTQFSSTDVQIAMALIDAINEDGYLTSKLGDIKQILDSDDHQIELDEIEAVLHQIQNFDPLGVGARDLSECLLLQLRTLEPNIPDLDNARRLATQQNLALLASRDYTQIRRHLKIGEVELQQAIELIQGLNPRPGSALQASQATYIVPDIVVKKIKGVWRADLNMEVSPRLRINSYYKKLIHRGDTSSDNKYLQEQLQQARWFIKSLNSRNETLLTVARNIVDRQRAFFDHGPEAMKPLVLHDIAESVSMHESTISRVTTNKYMLTPKGVFELKYFFSSHVSTIGGGTCSATAIRSLIKKLVENEKTSKPISDSKIAEILEGQGIQVARRTVAKYRESMNIPPSNQRKSLM